MLSCLTLEHSLLSLVTYEYHQIRHRGGQLIKDDLAGFDGPFFSMTSAEAACMNPQQRWLLEVAYEALENGMYYRLLKLNQSDHLPFTWGYY